MRNASAVLHGPHDVRLEDRPVPRPAAREVLVEIAAVGICGSDVHYYEHGRIGDYVVRSPMVIGHESAGTVVEVGDDIDPGRVGQLVASSPESRAGTAPSAGAAGTTSARSSCSWPPRRSTARSAGSSPSLGMGADSVALDVPLVEGRELSITGVFRYADTYPLALQLIGSGAVNVDDVITHRFAIEDTEDALTLARRERESLKAIVLPVRATSVTVLS
jgi:threonine dehydrogenase-like Zn-dependent dehydrogenase